MGTHLRVKELTDTKGWSIGKLAKRARLDYSVTHRYYHDSVKAWDRAVLEKLAWALGVAVGELFGGVPEPRWDDRRALCAVPA
jgi:Cro/C1-type HTH DNA-binding domain